jgi:hypothetical protein
MNADKNKFILMDMDVRCAANRDYARRQQIQIYDSYAAPQRRLSKSTCDAQLLTMPLHTSQHNNSSHLQIRQIIHHIFFVLDKKAVLTGRIHKYKYLVHQKAQGR